MTQPTTQLPNKLSALLRLAVQDAQKCERDPRYELNMGAWHVLEDGDATCQVCMAGAVMAQTLQYPIDRRVTWSDASHMDNTMHAIDNMRTGDFVSAAASLSVRPTTEQTRSLRRARGLVCEFYEAEDYTPHEEDPSDHYGRADWETYLECADILEGAGL